MSLNRLILVATFLILHTPSSAPALRFQGQTDVQARKPGFSTPEQIKEDIDGVPCKSNSDRLKAVKTLFEKMGAPASDISIEKLDGVDNIVLRKQGSSPELIVVGAHYDKVSHGCGAVDNWTGIVAIAHIYKTVKDIPLKKSVLFVGFGREEEGLIGSKAMAKAIDKDRLNQYCAMINIDSLGLGVAQAESGISSKKLVTRAADLAKRMKMPFQQASIFDANSDSSSFLERKIPAISIHGLSNQWKEILHTHNDRVSKVNTMSVFMGYRLALALFGELENSSCDAFR